MRKNDIVHLDRFEKRFWSKVTIGGPDECWPWTASASNFGAGQIRVQIGEKHYNRRAHRMAYILHHGELDDALDARHRCDNPPCCNPNHLIPGTHLDNMRDMSERGRQWKTKVLPSLRREIKRRARAGESASSIARSLGLSRKTVSNAANGGRKGASVFGTHYKGAEQHLTDIRHIDRLKVRFWAKVNKNGPVIRPELGPCWLWTGGTLEGGYGHVKVMTAEGKQKLIMAHRIAYLLKHGHIPAETLLRHRCNNPPCVREEHLIPGTQVDNVQDMIDSGRLRVPGVEVCAV